MNTKEIENKILEVRETIEQVRKFHIQPLTEEISRLRKEKMKSIMMNKEYVTDLSTFNEKCIKKIIALDVDGNEIYLPLDEIVKVEDNRLYCSSLRDGLVQWDEDEQSYFQSFHHVSNKLNIIGFIDIVVDND